MRSKKFDSTKIENSGAETNNEYEVELQMRTIMEFKYYRHHVMSRKFRKT